MRTRSSVAVGDTLEERAIPITTTLIVAGALASRDYQAVHHDAEVARARGLRDIIMNIHTTEGLVTTFVNNWAGPSSTIKRVTLRLGVSNYPGDTMRLSGVVTALNDGVADVTVTGANALGDHVTATVSIALEEA